MIDGVASETYKSQFHLGLCCVSRSFNLRTFRSIKDWTDAYRAGFHQWRLENSRQHKQHRCFAMREVPGGSGRDLCNLDPLNPSRITGAQ